MKGADKAYDGSNMVNDMFENFKIYVEMLTQARSTRKL